MKVVEVRKLAGVLAGLVVLQKSTGEVWTWISDEESIS
jgi:hypothetical protein